VTLGALGLRDQARSARNHCTDSRSQTVETMAVAKPCAPTRDPEETLRDVSRKTANPLFNAAN